MKVVLIDKEESYQVGGMGVFTKRFLLYLEKQGHSVHILRFTNKKKTTSIRNIPYWYAEPRTFIWIPSISTFTEMKKALEQIHPDIVYVGLPISLVDAFIPHICHHLNIPIAGIWHSDIHTDNRLMKKMTQAMFLWYLPFCKQLDLLQVFSDDMKALYASHGISPDKIFVLPNGVDSKFYTPGKSTFAIDHHISLGILFLGRMTSWKNPEMLIRSFLRVHDQHVTLVMVGPGDLLPHLKKTYTDPRILFTDIVRDEKQKRDIIRACQIFVIPSRVEGASLSLLEAMSCGLACITTDVGIHKEVIGESGIVLQRPYWEDHLTSSLYTLIHDDKIRQTLGKKARERIKDQYDQKDIFQKIEKKLHTCSMQYHASRN